MKSQTKIFKTPVFALRVGDSFFRADGNLHFSLCESATRQILPALANTGPGERFAFACSTRKFAGATRVPVILHNAGFPMFGVYPNALMPFAEHWILGRIKLANVKALFVRVDFEPPRIARSPWLKLRRDIMTYAYGDKLALWFCDGWIKKLFGKIGVRERVRLKASTVKTKGSRAVYLRADSITGDAFWGLAADACWRTLYAAASKFAIAQLGINGTPREFFITLERYGKGRK